MISKLHPLTRRINPVPATILAWLVALATFAAVTAIEFSVVPLVAWDHWQDLPFAISFGQLMHLACESGRSLSCHAGPGGLLDYLANGPGTFSSSIRSLDLTVPLVIRLGAAVLTATALGILTYREALAKAFAEPNVTHISGLRLLAGRRALASLRRSWAARFGAADPGIDLAAKLTMPRRLEEEHLLVLGATGSGKTTILQHLMSGTVERGDRMVAVDVKGDVTASLPTDAFALFALDDVRSVNWLAGDDITDETTASEFAALCVAETSDPAWSNGARRVLTAIILLAKQRAQHAKRVWTWHDVDDLLLLPIGDLCKAVRTISHAVADMIDVESERGSRQAMSFYLVLISGAGQTISALARMGRGETTEGFSIRRWLGQDHRRVIILRQSQVAPETTASIARIVLKLVTDNVLSTNKARKSRGPVWFYLDELPQLGKVASVTRLATIGRSFGARLVVTVQSPAQLRDTYGADGAQTLLDNLNTKIVTRLAPGATAEEVSSTWIGQRTVEWWEDVMDAQGHSHSQRATKDIPVVSPELLSGDLGLTWTMSGQAVIRALVTGHGDVCRVEWPVNHWPTRRPATVAPEAQSSVAEPQPNTSGSEAR